MRNKIIIVMLVLLAVFSFAGCSNQADVVSQNISKEADQFRVLRRIVFYNGITEEYMLVIEGFCSLGNFDDQRELTVTCQVGGGAYKKHFLGLSDNVTYFVEQLESANVSPDHYEVIFRPQVILPDIRVE